MKRIFDLEQSPFMVAWETTQTCDPDYCLMTCQPARDPLELNSAEAEKMIRDVAALRPPVFVMTGGAPLERDDIYGLVCYAASCDLHPVLVMSAGPQLTRSAMAKLKNASLSRLGLILDGAEADVHDSIHGEGAFSHTVDAIRWANEFRLPLQVHTTVCRRNLGELEKIAALLNTHRVLLWSVSFPVLRHQELLTAEETEHAFARLYRLSRLVPFKIKTTEAPHYRRYILQQRTHLKIAHAALEDGVPGVLPVAEGRGSVFITNTGEIYPGACLPVSAGNVRTNNLGEVYRESDLFQSLRDTSRLHGKCGRCNFKEICGGSRSRALAMAEDMFAEDPSCTYEPPALARTQDSASNAL